MASADQNLAELLTIGTRFDTPHETECIVTEVPDMTHPNLEFLARDSEGVECAFCVAMVINIYGEGNQCQGIDGIGQCYGVATHGNYCPRHAGIIG